MAKIRRLKAPINQAYERSQIVAGAEESLRQEFLQGETRARGRYRSRSRFPCPECRDHGALVTMPGWMLKGHKLNHRIYRALGEELAWVKELQEKETRRHKQAVERGKAIGGKYSGREKAGPQWDEWEWVRTVLTMGEGQQRRLAWVTIHLWEPVLLVPRGSWPDQAVRWPWRIHNAMEACRCIGSRLAGDCQCLLQGILSRDERAALKSAYQPKKIFDKSIVHSAVMIRFIQLVRVNV